MNKTTVRESIRRMLSGDVNAVQDGERVLLTVLVVVGTVLLYMSAENVFRRLPRSAFDTYFVVGSMHLQAWSFPLMVLDTLVMAALIGLAILATVSTDVTDYPLLYPPTSQAPFLVVCVLATDLGRYLAKLLLCVHNRPAREIRYPAFALLANCTFLATSLCTGTCMGLCLVGIVSEAASLLKCIHYLPATATSTGGMPSRCFRVLCVVKLSVTFLVKGVSVLTWTTLAFISQISIPDHAWTLVFASLFVAILLAGINFFHIMMFTTFTLEQLKGGHASTKHWGGSRLWDTDRLNTFTKATTMLPICYVNNAISRDHHVNSDVNVNVTPNDASNVKEKNCNVEQQRCARVDGKTVNTDREAAAGAGKCSALVHRPRVVTECMDTIPEETTSQLAIRL